MSDASTEPWLNGLFVKADREEVVTLFRGLAADTDEDWYEVSGKAARIDLRFGPEAGYRDMEPRLVEVTNQTWEISGYCRVSTVACNPSWVFVEHAGPIEAFQDLIEDWTQSEKSIAVWSVDWFWEPRGALIDVDEGYSIREGFSYHSGGDCRWVEYVENIHDGRSFTAQGTPQAFEDLSWYEARPKRDRISRAILFDILGKLGIDGISVFERRELDAPLFYTSRIKGKPCSEFVEERKRVSRFWESS